MDDTAGASDVYFEAVVSAVNERTVSVVTDLVIGNVPVSGIDT